MSRGYRQFATERRAMLRTGSRVTSTAAGPVEHTEAGPHDAIPIMLFHGSPGGYDHAWLLDPLLALGVGVIAWSRPGYLRTPLGAAGSFPAQADTAAALLDEIGVRRVVAHGMSGGGPAALEFARRHPRRTAGLILESAITRRYRPEIPALARALFLTPYGTWAATRLARRLPRAVLRDFIRRESTFDRKDRRRAEDEILADPERLEVMHRLMLSLTPYEDRAAGLRNDLDRFAHLDDTLTLGITCPTLILHGSEDGDADPGHARHAAHTISRATIHLVPGAWHVLRMSGGYQSTLAAVRSFLTTTGEA